MKIKICGIYKITNLINGKIYIGSSIDIKSRWYNHKNQLKLQIHENKHLQNAYNKYGLDNFKFEIMEECEEGKRNEREQYYMDFYECTNENKGYNNRKIAESNTGLKHSSETIEKMKIAQKGRTFSEESLKRMSESHKGAIVTDDHKQKIGLSQSGEKCKHAKLNWILVEEIRFKYSQGGISTIKLAKDYNVSTSTIQKIIEYRSWKLENNPHKSQQIS